MARLKDQRCAASLSSVSLHHCNAIKNSTNHGASPRTKTCTGLILPTLTFPPLQQPWLLTTLRIRLHRFCVPRSYGWQGLEEVRLKRRACCAACLPCGTWGLLRAGTEKQPPLLRSGDLGENSGKTQNDNSCHPDSCQLLSAFALDTSDAQSPEVMTLFGLPRLSSTLIAT